MKCPKDNTDLVTSERHGVQIDHCPKCRGVWLDRGELDKIIDQAAGALALPEPTPPTPPIQEYREPYREKSHSPREYREPYREDDDDRRYSKNIQRKKVP